MLKLLEAFDYPGEAHITLLHFNKSGGGLEKKASYEEIDSFCKTLESKPGYTYLHILAMGSAEYWGHNRNCDSFPEYNLKKYYKTFETTPARLYRNHINKDTNNSFGTVIFSCYNENMHRIELVVECKNELVEDINREIAMGKYPATSMATKTPSDRCSICGNRARTRSEYCSHLRTELGKLYPDGRRVVAINDDALIFFDISKVIRPADVTSSVLVKLANAQVQGSAEIAEVEGLFDKTAELKKVSELIKEVEGNIVKVIPSSVEQEILSKTKDLPISLIPGLANFDLVEVLKSLAKNGISPSVRFLSELISYKQLGPDYFGIGELVEEYLREHGLPPEATLPNLDNSSIEESPFLTNMLSKYTADSSIFPQYIEKRASNIGYSGLGPFIEPLPEEGLNIEGDKNPSFLKMLGFIGLAGLAAKYYITNEIKKQNDLTNNKNQVKIVLIKSAKDSNYFADVSFLKEASTIVVRSKPTQEQDNNTNNLNFFSRIARKLLKKSNTPTGQKLSDLIKIVTLTSRVV